jgi:hypothetical protein
MDEGNTRETVTTAPGVVEVRRTAIRAPGPGQS